jgi:hypothetical protein
MNHMELEVGFQNWIGMIGSKERKKEKAWSKK